ncbi:ferredoxin reductase-like protein [Conidiobolus coronatus NRRL 28638]|uniref:NADH-cytochrome b5 reductase n=1 Tax=Conidiobolus coronatus (strain ATCC 28846 / CBS 209.66 / NRRL 28638) TaxID=796925 RepID=A0A137P6R6_CONC2|nr:ferredoxin reductase-like protein [Conidiobolus coronatus NRRL 28638]|eukprot:KXN70707.1 ferredoxin reductase-like protein [Conidiobolus coronatus NRRL 28638]
MRSILKSSNLLKQSLNTFNRSAFAARANYSSAADGAKSGNSNLLLGALAVAAGAGSYYYFSGNEAKVAAKSENKSDDLLLSPKEFKSFKLKEVQDINYNTKLFRFELPVDRSLDLPVASCVVTRAPGKNGKNVIRPYTPTSEENAKGHFDFIIKHYEGGPMSTHIHNLKVGDTLEVKGPFPKYFYKANTIDEAGLIAGGTGITPMLQLIRKILDNPADKTKINLIFANNTTKDILLKDELDKLAKQHADRFKVKYVIAKQESGWTGDVGFVTKDLIKKTLQGSQNKDSMVFVCGPDPMINVLSGPKNPDKSQGELGGILKELGYTSENVYKF